MAETASSVVPAQAREQKGKGPARRLRLTGLIPAVVYGRGTAPQPIAVDPAAIEKAIATPHRLNTLITLKMDGGERRVLLKDYQVDPVTRRLLHADFLEVDLTRPVRVGVPVVTTGKAEGVVQGGILSVAAYQILLEALPARIPAQIEVDVTSLKIGQSIHISELKAPEGCTFKYSTDYVVAFVAVPEKEEVVAPPPAIPGAVPAEGVPPVPGVPPAPGAAPGAPIPGAPGAPVAAAAAAPAKGAPPPRGGEVKGPSKK